MTFPPRRVAAVLSLCALALLATGCGGGGDRPDPFVPPAFDFVTQILGLAPDPGGNLAANGVYGVQFSVEGPGGSSFAISPEFSVDMGPFQSASEIPGPLAATLMVTSSGTMGLTLPAAAVAEGVSGGRTSATFTFYWHAGANLGFLGGNVDFRLSAFNNGTPGTPNGNLGSFGPFTYTPSFPPAASAGNAAGATPGNPDPTMTEVGRAGLDAHMVRGAGTGSDPSLLLSGGYNGAAAPNAFDGSDRFTFDQANFTHTVGMSFTMRGRRVYQASAPLFSGSKTGSVGVLVTGGVDRADPTQGNLASRVAGATVQTDGYVYDPSTDMTAVTGALQVARFQHSATWTASGEVVLIGGATDTAGTATGAIEHWDPVSAAFVNPNGGGALPSLSAARVGHRATLLANGRTILISGGYDPASPSTARFCELYDSSNPVAGTIVIATAGSSMNRVGHTATRLFNGWVLITGGVHPGTGAVAQDAVVYRPESNDFMTVTMPEARALHSATLLGNGQVLIAGGATAFGAGVVPSTFTTSTEIFRLVAQMGGFSPDIARGSALGTARGEHGAAAITSGRVFIIGGRNEMGGTPNFLDSIEFFGFSNSVPVISSFTSEGEGQEGGLATIDIAIGVTDAEQDGGYVVLRQRQVGSVAWSPATIAAQSFNGNASDLTMGVAPGLNGFSWAYGSDGYSGGEQVEIEVLPFGAAVGTPVRFTVTLP